MEEVCVRATLRFTGISSTAELSLFSSYLEWDVEVNAPE